MQLEAALDRAIVLFGNPSEWSSSRWEEIKNVALAAGEDILRQLVCIACVSVYTLCCLLMRRQPEASLAVVAKYTDLNKKQLTAILQAFESQNGDASTCVAVSIPLHGVASIYNFCFYMSHYHSAAGTSIRSSLQAKLCALSRLQCCPISKVSLSASSESSQALTRTNWRLCTRVRLSLLDL